MARGRAAATRHHAGNREQGFRACRHGERVDDSRADDASRVPHRVELNLGETAVINLGPVPSNPDDDDLIPTPAKSARSAGWQFTGTEADGDAVSGYADGCHARVGCGRRGEVAAASNAQCRVRCPLVSVGMPVAAETCHAERCDRPGTRSVLARSGPKRIAPGVRTFPIYAVSGLRDLIRMALMRSLAQTRRFTRC